MCEFDLPQPTGLEVEIRYIMINRSIWALYSIVISAWLHYERKATSGRIRAVAYAEFVDECFKPVKLNLPYVCVGMIADLVTHQVFNF